MFQIKCKSISYKLVACQLASPFWLIQKSKDNDTSDHHPSKVLVEWQPQSGYPKAILWPNHIALLIQKVRATIIMELISNFLYP